MPQIDCICGIFALHGIILHQGHGFVKGFSAIFLEKGKKRRNTKKLPKKRACLLCILLFMKPLPRRAESRFAKPRQTFRKESYKVFCPTFCTLQKVGKMPPAAAKGFNFVRAKPPLRRAESRFAKPRNSLRGNGLVLFAACKKYRKNTPRVATLWTPGDDSKLCRRRF